MPAENEIQGVNRRQQYGPTERPVNLQDPEIDWESVAQMFQLSPEEVQQLQVQPPAEGRSLADRIRALRPQTNIGNLELMLDGDKLKGRMEF